MTVQAPELTRFVHDLRAITLRTGDPREIVERVRPLARTLALSQGWLEEAHRSCDDEQGFGVHLLHEEPDHTLAVIVGAWLPGRGAPPHNHGTWAVVAGVEGVEKNTFWTRVDDGSRPGRAEIRKGAEQLLGPGEVVTFQPDTIHSVDNETARVTLSLHVYGKNVNHTGRSQFDPEGNVEKAFVLTID
jgi:predicted metal-dependent enzyme (double-stranded beta helix superfamily)